jgi:hypothetical protein
MPRIPTSKPQDVRSRPSVGGQVSIRSQDSFFRSIAAASQEAGQLFEQARAEEQKIADADALNKQRIYQISESTRLKESLTSTSVDQHNDLIEEWIANNQKYDLGPSASNEARTQASMANDMWVQQSISSAKISSTQRRESEARQNAASLQNLAIDSLDREGAIGAWSGILSADQLDTQIKLIDQGIANEAEKRQRESDNAISAELLTNTDQFSLQNNLQGIEEQIKILDSGEGLAARMTEVKRLATRNSMVQAKNGIVARRAKAFDDVLKKAVDVGVLNDETLSDMKDRGLLTDEQEVQMRSIFSSKQRTEELNKEFDTDKADVSYKTVYNELGEDFLEKFAEGDNVEIEEEQVREYEKRIDSLPVGIIAKNKLRSRLALAASVAILDSDSSISPWTTFLGEEWEGLPDQRRLELSDFANRAAKIMLESNKSKFLLMDEGVPVDDVDFADLLIDDLNFFAKQLNAGVDPKELKMGDRLRSYRVGQVKLQIKQKLLNPEAVDQ